MRIHEHSEIDASNTASEGRTRFGFTYDANGNLTSGGGKTLTWTSYNYPASVTRGGSTFMFEYGPNRQRITETGPGYTRATVNAYFEVAAEGTATTYKHYIHAGSKVVAIHDRKSDFHHTTHYLHRDRLGSVDTITDEDGTVIVVGIIGGLITAAYLFKKMPSNKTVLYAVSAFVLSYYFFCGAFDS